MLAIVMGAVAIWDVGGMATAIRARLETRPVVGGWYKRLPPWAFRAFGVWCVVFGVGQLVYVYAITHGAS